MKICLEGLKSMVVVLDIAGCLHDAFTIPGLVLLCTGGFRKRKGDKVGSSQPWLPLTEKRDQCTVT